MINIILRRKYNIPELSVIPVELYDVLAESNTETIVDDENEIVW